MLQRFWPRTLFHRLTLILFSGLIVAHALNFGLILHERGQAAEMVMAANLANDVATSVALLERLPPAARDAWLGRLERKGYRYFLNRPQNSRALSSTQAQKWIVPITSALGPHYSVIATGPTRANDSMQLHLYLQLADGTPLTVELFSPHTPHSMWVPIILMMQLVMLGALTWVAVRLATRPLAKLANAADALGPDLRGEPLAEDGPMEVARAAAAFNAMQQRIADHLNERIQILAAVSHDLQTPITRMRLRADLMDNPVQREKMYGDLNAMQVLVEEGIAYARSAQDVIEIPCRIDLDALLDSLVCDYLDAGQPIRLSGQFGWPLMTRPHALRRLMTNLVDNALKFGVDTEIMVAVEPPGHLSIYVRDRGPGIRHTELEAVLQPFYRVEGSRNRQTGGTGLGLAIAQQLALALGGALALTNREGGGLEARLCLPISTWQG